MTFIAALLVVGVLVTPVQGASRFGTRDASAAVTRTFYASGGLTGGLNAFRVKVDGQFSVIDNSTVRLDWGGCNTSWAYGVSIDYTWKGTYRDPYNRWLEVGCNFNVYALVKGFPLSTGFWLRLRAYPDGSARQFWGYL